MGMFNTLDSPQPFSELDAPLIGSAEGTISAANRKARAVVNLGITASAAELAFLDNVVAGTAQASKALVLDSAGGIAGPFKDERASPVFKQGAPAAFNATGTMTAANLLTGIITSTTAAAVAATLPLATDFETALLAIYPGLAVDDAYDFSVIVTGVTNAFTMTTNTGWTLVGDMTVAPLAVGDQSGGIFRARRTAANTYTLYRVA